MTDTCRVSGPVTSSTGLYGYECGEGLHSVAAIKTPQLERGYCVYVYLVAMKIRWILWWGLTERRRWWRNDEVHTAYGYS
jgi:hypothetical protein